MRRLPLEVVCFALLCTPQAHAADEGFYQAWISAKAEEARLEYDAAFMAWAKQELVPFTGNEIQAVFAGCAEALKPGEKESMNLVLELRSGSTPSRVLRETETPYSRCVASSLAKMPWPKMLFRKKYAPISATVEYAPDAWKAADDVIVSITTGDGVRLVNYTCDDASRVQVTYSQSPGAAALMRYPVRTTLPQQPSGSGFIYGDGTTTLRGKGEEITLEEAGKPPMICKEGSR